MKKSPELAKKVYEILWHRAKKRNDQANDYDIKYENWHKWLKKYKAVQMQIYFDSKRDENLFQELNSTNKFIYVSDPHQPEEYLIKIPLEMAQKIATIGSLGQLP